VAGVFPEWLAFRKSLKINAGKEPGTFSVTLPPPKLAPYFPVSLFQEAEAM
jgi:hypothetical protein